MSEEQIDVAEAGVGGVLIITSVKSNINVHILCFNTEITHLAKSRTIPIHYLVFTDHRTGNGLYCLNISECFHSLVLAVFIRILLLKLDIDGDTSILPYRHPILTIEMIQEV